jgi:hypothetical protein
VELNNLEEQQDIDSQEAIATSLENTMTGAEAQAARVAKRQRIQERLRRRQQAEQRQKTYGIYPLTADPETVAKVMDIPKGAVAGVLKATESIKNLAIDVLAAKVKSEIGDEEVRLPDGETLSIADVTTAFETLKENVSLQQITPKAKTAAGKVVESITQFATGFVPVGQAARAAGVAKAAAKVPKAIKTAAKEAVPVFISFEERMALTEHLVNAVDPELAKKLPAYLKKDADDSPFETRLVNALEAAGVTLAAGFVLTGVRSVREMHRAKQARTVVEKTVKPVQEKMVKVRTRLEKLAKEQAQPPEAVQRLKKAVEEPAKETKTRKELDEAAKLLGTTVEDLRSRDAYKAAKDLKIDEQIAAVTVIQDNQYQEMAKAFTDLESLVNAGDVQAARTVAGVAEDFTKIARTARDVASGAARGVQFRAKRESVTWFNTVQELVAEGKLTIEDEIDYAKALIQLAKNGGDVAGFLGGPSKQTLTKVKDVNDLIARRFKSFLLSSPVSMARDVTSDMYRHTWEVADRFAAATVGAARRGAKAAKTVKKEKGWMGFTDAAYRNGAFRQATAPTDITFTEAKALAEGYAHYWKQVVVGTAKIAKLNAKKGAEAAVEQGPIKGLKTGVGSFLDDMVEKAKSVRLDSSTKLNVQETDVKIAELAGKPNSVVLRGLDYATSAMEPVLGFYRNKDHVGQAIVFRSELQARAISRATNEGLTGEAFNARVKELTTDVWEQENLKDFLDTKKLSSLKNKTLAQQVSAGRQARAEAKRVSLTEDLTGVGKAAESLVRNIPGGDLLFPFVKTTYNLTKYELSKSPLSLLNVRGDSLTQKAIRSGSGREKDLAVGRMAMSTGVHTLAFKMAYDGFVRGSVIKDPGQRNTLNNAGMFENSMRIGDTVIGLNDFSPLSAPFIRAANVVELFHYMDGDTIEDDIAEDITNYLSSAMLGTADQIMSSNFTGQLGDLFNILTEQDEYGLKRTGKSLVTGLTVPGAVAWTSRFFEDNKKQTDTLWESVLARLNLGEDKLDKFGRPIPKRSTAWGNVLPLSITQYGANDKLAIEELNNGTIISKPSRRVPTPLGQARLKPEEYNRLLELVGELKTYDKLMTVVESPMYQSLPAVPAKEMEKIGPATATRGGVLRKLYQTDLKVAQERLLLEYPEITGRVVSDKKEYFVEGKTAPVTRFAPKAE